EVARAFPQNTGDDSRPAPRYLISALMISRIFIAALTFAASAIAFWVSARLRRDFNRTRNWPTAPGKIVQRGTTPMQSDARSFTPEVKYVYTVGGKEYAGQQFYCTGRVGSTQKPTQRLVNALPDSIPVHYNPANPSDAFLLPNPPTIFWIAVALGFAALVWGLLQLLTFVVE